MVLLWLPEAHGQCFLHGESVFFACRGEIVGRCWVGDVARCRVKERGVVGSVLLHAVLADPLVVGESKWLLVKAVAVVG